MYTYKVSIICIIIVNFLKKVHKININGKKVTSMTSAIEFYIKRNI